VYLIYTVILMVLAFILIITLKEEVRTRKGITRGLANKYWVLREKRRFVRFQQDFKIRYDLAGSRPDSGNIKMKNISRKGLCISTYEKLKVNDTLALEIDMPGFSKTVKLTGAIIWVKELHSADDHGRRIFYAGLKFLKISPESEAILITHLNTLRRP